MDDATGHHGISVSARGEYEGGHFMYDGAGFNAVQRSVTALAIYDQFVGADGHVVDPDVDTVRSALARIPQ